MSARSAHPRSIRAHLLGIVLFGAILPLALIGAWLTWNAIGGGKQQLDDELTASLQGVEHAINARWQYRVGDLLLLSTNENARQVLATGVMTAADSAYFLQLAATTANAMPGFAYHDSAGREIYATPPARDSGNKNPSPARPALQVSYPVTANGKVVGALDGAVYLDAIIPSDSARLLLPGSALALRDRSHHVVLTRLSPDRDFPAASEITVRGAPWLARIGSLDDPPFDIAVAAPVATYVARFERAGKIGFAALMAVTLLAVLLTWFLTARLAQSVGSLVTAVETVAGGDLTREVTPTGPSELHRLAGSFNAMTASLRGLLAELSQRRALAAVGEFAASLSHEVRNALTSVQIDLERVDERSEDVKNRILVERALIHVRRLDAAVTGSLRIARSGTIEATAVRLADVLRESVRIAESSFAVGGSRLRLGPFDDTLMVSGDPDALHQLFLNLLLNAQQALAANGEAVVSATPSSHDTVVVSIADTGCGMTAEQVARAFDLHYTTRPRGSGLGLSIARQIAIAHGGELVIRSVAGVGTTVEVTLPRREMAV